MIWFHFAKSGEYKTTSLSRRVFNSLKLKNKRTYFLITEIHTISVLKAFLFIELLENLLKHVCFLPLCAVLRINSCVGESNHQAFMLALLIFLLTSVYGITLTLDTICTDRSVFTALFYCPGVYANYRWDMDIPYGAPRKREWICSECTGLWFTARLGVLTQNTGQVLEMLGIPEIANTQLCSGYVHFSGWCHKERWP